MEDRTVGHRSREIGTEAAVHRHRQLQATQTARAVKAHGVSIFEGMALASDQKVIVPIQPQFDRALDFVGRNGRPHCQVASLGFLATESAAHASAFDLHRMVVQP